MEDKENKDNLISNDQVNETTESMVEEFAVYKDEDAEGVIKENLADEQVLKDTEAKVKSQKTNKSRIINLVFFCISVVVLVVILLYQSRKYGIKDPGDLFKENVSFKGIGLIVLVFLAIMFLESFRTWLLILKATKISRPVISYKSTAICRYYDCITPFSFGGQPFQIYYLSTRGVNTGVATSVPLAKYMYSQISFCLIALIMLIVGSGMWGTKSSLVVGLSIVSLIISVVFLLLIIFITLSKKVASRLIIGFIKFLSKIKLVKNYEKTSRVVYRSLSEYQKSIRFYLKDFWTSLLAFISSAGVVLLKALIPYLIYVMLSDNIEVGFSIIFCKFIVCELATMYVPLPGGSGVAEISFTALFASLFSDGLLFWAMLIYRIASYYIYILQGFIVILYDIIIGDKRDRKYKETKLVELKMKVNYRK